MSWPKRIATQSTVRRLWQGAGRAWVENYMGLTWSGVAWSLDESWHESYTPEIVATRAYFANNTLYPMTRFAAHFDDRGLIDELCEIWTVYAARLMTIADIKLLGAHLLDDAGPDTYRILPDTKSTGQYVDSHIHLSQGYASAFRLLRCVAGIPAGERTASMDDFVAAWAEVLMTEQAYRKAVLAHTVTWTPEPWDPVRANRWAQLKDVPLGTSSPSYYDAVIDSDLWQLLNIAEALEAYRLDPTLYAWPAEERAALEAALPDGLAWVQSRIAHKPEGDWWFPGEFAEHPDYDYAGETGEDNPFGEDPVRSETVGWDCSHYFRVPVFIRGLMECRDVVGAWPTEEDAKRAGDYYATVCWNGDRHNPLTSNFVNGEDGWYRVADGAGYPPSVYGNAQGSGTYTFFPGNVSGWGAIASLCPSIRHMLGAYIRLAQYTASRPWRDRYTYYAGHAWDIHGTPMVMIWILGMAPELLHRVPPSSSGQEPTSRNRIGFAI